MGRDLERSSPLNKILLTGEGTVGFHVMRYAVQRSVTFTRVVKRHEEREAKHLLQDT
jgi:hypothetical protein